MSTNKTEHEPQLTPRFQQIHVIINPASGKNEPILNTLNDVFQDYPVEWNVSITRGSGDAAQQSRDAVQRGCDLVMVYGGDGTIMDAAEGLLETDVPLGILPGGTANALADELWIPVKLEEAARLVCDEHASVRAIDVGRTGERHFLLRVGTGMIAKVSESVTRESKDRFGIGAYIIAGIQALSQPQFVQYQLTIDSTTYETEGAACLITNGNAIGALGIRLSKHIRLDDGLLDVFILNNDLQTVLAVAGSIAQIDDFAISLQHWQGKEIYVQADPPQRIYADGENQPFAETPSTTRILSGALKVVVPQHTV